MRSIRVYPPALVTRFAVVGVVVLAAFPPTIAHGGVCAPGEQPDVDVAFVAVALDGPAEPSTGDLVSPARFHVERWIEGSGRDEVEVETAVEVQGQLIQRSSIGITPKAGERWRIRGDRGPGGVIVTSICTGSELLAGDENAPDEHAPAPRIDEPPAGPGDDRALSLGVAAAAAVAIAVVISRERT